VTPRRIELLGVPVDCVTMAQSVDFVDERVATGSQCAAILAVNPEKIMRARVDPILRGNLRQAALLIPDGIGAVWGARILANASIGRVPGSELMPALCARAAKKGYGVFLFGGTEEVNKKAAAVLRKHNPGLRIAGRHHGYVDDDTMSGLIEQINKSGAEILFVALGSPRQEAWIADHSAALRVNAVQGVGGTFDVIAGQVRRAPKLFLSLNLEWCYRLLREPKRLWRQRLLIYFVVAVLWEWGTGET
jgi:N-acetylglucosaminyldiphosphoundecaprenol N-acetyl-beta-D-mannosaminyltransferase